MQDVPLVFISHSSTDTWVAKQIAAHVRACGAEVFLDEADIAHGDDFEGRIVQAAKAATELIVLLTPWAMNRPYIWLEIGVFWGDQKRMVGVLHGMTAKAFTADEQTPVVLKRLSLVTLNDVETYFEQLRARVTQWKTDHA
ncbi:MAG TPA: toll/interleukin-1 receptor domain-containing protein [Thermoanaerobaculia bacterium]